jgi:hypothetical protein
MRHERRQARDVLVMAFTTSAGVCAAELFRDIAVPAKRRGADARQQAGNANSRGSVLPAPPTLQRGTSARPLQPAQSVTIAAAAQIFCPNICTPSLLASRF